MLVVSKLHGGKIYINPNQVIAFERAEVDTNPNADKPRDPKQTYKPKMKEMTCIHMLRQGVWVEETPVEILAQMGLEFAKPSEETTQSNVTELRPT